MKTLFVNIPKNKSFYPYDDTRNVGGKVKTEEVKVEPLLLIEQVQYQNPINIHLYI